MRAEGKDGVARVANPQPVIVRDRRRDRHGRVWVARMEQGEQPLLRVEHAWVSPCASLRNRVVQFPDLRVIVGEPARARAILGDVSFDLLLPSHSLGLWDGAMNDDGPDSLDLIGDFVREAGLDVGVFDLRDQLFRGILLVRMIAMLRGEPMYVQRFRLDGFRRNGGRATPKPNATTRRGRRRKAAP